MNKIPGAKQSPRIENGVIYWFEGSTFELGIIIALTDDEGTPISLDDYTITVRFKDESLTTVKTFTFSGSDIDEGTIVMDFDASCTALFPAGEYEYTIDVADDYKTPVAVRNKVVVECV